MAMKNIFVAAAKVFARLRKLARILSSFLEHAQAFCEEAACILVS